MLAMTRCTLALAILAAASTLALAKTPINSTVVASSGMDITMLVTALNNTSIMPIAAPGAILLCPLQFPLDDGTVVDAPSVMTSVNSTWVLDGEVIIADIPTVPGENTAESSFTIETNSHQVSVFVFVLIELHTSI